MDEYEEEDELLLEMGPQFASSDALMITEVRVLLEQQRVMQQQQRRQPGDVFLKTDDYVKNFDRYQTRDNVRAVRDALSHSGLRSYEIAYLANLMPSSVEEAKSLMPNLEKLRDDELQKLLFDLSTYGK